MKYSSWIGHVRFPQPYRTVFDCTLCLARSQARPDSPDHHPIAGGVLNRIFRGSKFRFQIDLDSTGNLPCAILHRSLLLTGGAGTWIL